MARRLETPQFLAPQAGKCTCCVVVIRAGAHCASMSECSPYLERWRRRSCFAFHDVRHARVSDSYPQCGGESCSPRRMPAPGCSDPRWDRRASRIPRVSLLRLEGGGRVHDQIPLVLVLVHVVRVIGHALPAAGRGEQERWIRATPQGARAGCELTVWKLRRWRRTDRHGILRYGRTPRCCPPASPSALGVRTRAAAELIRTHDR